MKMVLVICPETRIDEVRRLLDEHHLEGYTELGDVRGAGTTGKRLGTRAYPGSSCMVFVVVERSKVDELVEAFERFCARCSEAEGTRVLVLPVEKTI
jgi:nitrogen regulatory protein PII